MAQYRLIPSDVSTVLAEQNIESATGSFGENSDETYQYTMKYKGRRITPEEFGEIVIRSTDDGQVLKLKISPQSNWDRKVMLTVVRRTGITVSRVCSSRQPAPMPQR